MYNGGQEDQMRSRAVVFFCLFIGLAVSTAFAQTGNSPTNPSSATFSDQDKAAARREIEKVGEMFGVKKAEPPTPVRTKEEPVTVAEVADKALTMVGNAVGTIAGIVQKVAPEVWEIMVRQQYAAAVGMLVGPFLFLLLTGTYTLVVKKYWKKYPDSEPYFNKDKDPTEKLLRGLLTTLFPGLIGMVVAGTLAYRIGDALPMAINPKYYAVRDLLQMLLK